MSEQPTNTALALGLLVQTNFFLAAVIGIPEVVALGGQLHSLALAAVSVLLLLSFLVVGTVTSTDGSPSTSTSPS